LRIGPVYTYWPWAEWLNQVEIWFSKIRRLVQLQASFLLTAMRWQALALPQALCDRLAAAADPLEVRAILDSQVA
jgi:hypothetical protein